MAIYEASMDDLEAIRTVAEASWKYDYPDILSRETVDEGFDDWYGREQLVDEIADPKTQVFIAEVDSEIAGFAHAIVDGAEGVVLRLYVHPDHRREGVGRGLFEHVREKLVGYDVERIRAMVLAENQLGNSFYRDLGFEKVAEGETIIADELFEENAYEMVVK
jgi:ribosomal protein S18 acetylase RimI-like enzyme